MHNREITHIVKTGSLSKAQLVVRTKCAFLLSFERNLSKNMCYETTMQNLDFRL